MKIAICQINTTVGDFAGNRRRIERAHAAAVDRGAELVLFPELAVTGYPPLDLLERSDFATAAARALEEIAGRLRGAPAIVGTIRHNSDRVGRRLFNTAAYIADGRVVAFRDKSLLPTYDVFDEGRYFQAGGPAEPLEIAGKKVGIAICEDLWNIEDPAFQYRYARNPALELRERGVDLVLCPSASPYHRQKEKLRDRIFLSQAKALGTPILFCNLVGGNTELIFDGHSMVATPAGIAIRGATFREDLLLVDTDRLGEASGAGAGEDQNEDEIEEMASALVLGLRDYFRKCGFRRAVVGLSGGIDSSVTAAVACEALGSAAVRGVAMPSRYSSEGSLTDARELARRLGMRFDVLSIEPIFDAYLACLAPLFHDTPPGVAEENIQSRIRGALLMAISNRFGDIVLATGNKSELSVGYSTLYGDMCGGLIVLGDVLKLDVYRLARLPRYRESIPPACLEKPPSAELRENQKDEDSLPPYEVLDPILSAYIEEQRAAGDIIADGFSRDTVEEVVAMVERNEYKRRQAAPVLRVTPKAFGMGRRYPIARNLPPYPGGGDREASAGDESPQATVKEG